MDESSLNTMLYGRTFHRDAERHPMFTAGLHRVWAAVGEHL